MCCTVQRVKSNEIKSDINASLSAECDNCIFEEE